MGEQRNAVRRNRIVCHRGLEAGKNADFTVVNTTDAMGQDESLACILEAGDEVPALKWAHRPKIELAKKIVELLEAKLL